MEPTTVFLLIITIGCMIGNVFYNVWVVKNEPWIQSSDSAKVAFSKAGLIVYIPAIVIILLWGYTTGMIIDAGYPDSWVTNASGAFLVIWIAATTFIPLFKGIKRNIQQLKEA